MILNIKILLLLSFLYSGILQAGDDQNRLKRFLVLDAVRAGDHIVASGERGHILLSQDNQKWQIINTQTTATLTSVYFLDSMLGWTAGHDSVILKTIDGGRHWRQVYHDPDRNSPILDIWFADKNNGIAIGAYGLYLLTADGGETWHKKDFTVMNRTSGDTAHGNAQSIASDGDTLAPYDLHLNAMANSESGKLYIVAEAGRVYRSDDVGKTWQELPSPYQGSFFGVLPLGAESLLVFGLRGHIYRSDDNGLTWNRIATHTSETLMGAVQLRNGSLVVTGMGGVVLTSDKQGSTFTTREIRYKHGYAAVIESGNGQVIIAGDHGIEHLKRKDLGLEHD